MGLQELTTFEALFLLFDLSEVCMHIVVMRKETQELKAKLSDLATRIARSCNDENVKPNYIHWSDAGNLLLLLNQVDQMEESNENLKRTLEVVIGMKSITNE